MSGISLAYVAKFPPKLGPHEKISRKFFQRNLQCLEKSFSDGFVTTALYVSREVFREIFPE